MLMTAGLLLWGMFVGLDLISVPQVMISRPLVAGVGAGLLTGDPVAGFAVGVILELFALDVLPVGAVRYPDYGPATVVAVAAAANTPIAGGVGVGVALGLGIAYLGEWSIVATRHLTSHHVQRAETELDAGSRGALSRVHLGGIARDGVRALSVTALGLLVAWGLRTWTPVPERAAILLTAAMTGAALATATLGALRLRERRRSIGWFATGLGISLVWVVLG